MPRPLLTLALLLLGAGALVAQSDTIIREDGRVVDQVRIQDESYTDIVYRTTRGVEQRIPTEEVARVVYGRTSSEFAAGMADIDTDNWQAAVQNLLAAADDDGLPDHVRATALITAGDALLTNGYWGDALTEYTRLLDQYRDSRHRPAALLGQGKALLFQQRFAEADEVLETLQKDTQARGFPQVWAQEAQFLLLLSAEAQGEKGLLERYTNLRMVTQGQFDGIANKAALRMARLMLAKQPPDLDRAEDLLQEIIGARADTDRDIVAGAYNTRGQIAFARGQAALKEKQSDAAVRHLEAALLDFLRVQVSYSQVRAEQPYALYWASQAFDLLAGLGAGGDDASLHARRLKGTLLAQFPDSEWGRKAAAE